MHIKLLKEIYTNSSMTVHLHKESNKINIRRGVRQGDTISPKLFTAALKSIFRLGKPEARAIFASPTTYSYVLIQHMLQELADESENQGLKMNKSKTKVMIENGTPVYINNTKVQNVESYIYLGHRQHQRQNHDSVKEKSQPDGQHSPSTATSSGVTLGHAWREHVLHTSGSDIRHGNMGTHHPSKEQASSCTNKDGKSTLNIIYRDRKINIWVREKIKVTDLIEQVRR